MPLSGPDWPSNALTPQIYFSNWILLYIPWIVMFLEFTYTKVTKSYNLLQLSSSLGLAIPI